MYIGSGMMTPETGTATVARRVVYTAVGFGLLVFLYWLSKFQYLLFHAVTELSVILFAAIIFVIAINTRKLTKNDYFTFLAVSNLYIALIEFSHTIAYKGMNIIPDITANEPTQLWLASRYLFSLSLLASCFLIGKKIRARYWIGIFAFYTLAVGAIFASIFHFRNFPAAFVEGEGLTLFKIVSEYVISGILVWAGMELWFRRGRFDRKVIMFLEFAIAAGVLAELSFTNYAGVYGFFNALGHFLMVISGYFLYKAFIEKTLQEPVATLFRDLQEANNRLRDLAERDGLTSLYNRRHALERITEQFSIAKRFGKPFCVIMADVDNLKHVNETYGHLAGDKVLSEFSSIIRQSIRKVDIAGRYGGDEFIICPIEADLPAAKAIAESIVTLASLAVVIENGEEIKFSASAGICHANGFSELRQVVDIADSNLLSSKRNGKNLVTVTEHVTA